MLKSVALVGSLLFPLFMAGCASTSNSDTARTSYTAERNAMPAALAAQDTRSGTAKAEKAALVFPTNPGGSLAGRSLRVSRVSDIALRDKEVVLTFDDGPMPGRTEKVLAALDRYGVKATFLMVGQMANAYPAIARKVAARGHTIGTHTQSHRNLAGMSTANAKAEIERGRKSVAAAVGSGNVAPFFRFPYLASTSALRRDLASNGVVVIDVDIDSKDYFKSSGDQVRARTIARIERRRKGVILLHDIHGRTAEMLPGFLADLKSRGYKVVALKPGRGSFLVASLD